MLDIKLYFTVYEILFDFWPSGNVISEAINYLILIEKRFLNNTFLRIFCLHKINIRSLIGSEQE